MKQIDDHFVWQENSIEAIESLFLLFEWCILPPYERKSITTAMHLYRPPTWNRWIIVIKHLFQNDPVGRIKYDWFGGFRGLINFEKREPSRRESTQPNSISISKWVSCFSARSINCSVHHSVHAITNTPILLNNNLEYIFINFMCSSVIIIDRNDVVPTL